MEVEADLGHLQLIEPEFLLMERQDPLVHGALAAPRAGDGDVLAVVDLLGAVARPDDAGDAQLPGDDRRVARAPALIGDDGRGGLHDGHPVRVGHFGDQDSALLEVLDVLRALDHVGRTAADGVAHGHALGKHAAGLLQHLPADDPRFPPGMHGLRPRLDDEQVSALPILGPFHVHGLEVAGLLRVVILDDLRPAGEGEHLFLVQTETVPLVLGHGDVLGSLALRRLDVDHFLLLFAQMGIDDGLESLF